MEDSIQFFNSSNINNNPFEKEKKQKKKILVVFSIVSMILILMSLISIISIKSECSFEVNKETNAYSYLKSLPNSNQAPLANTNLTREEYYSYSFNQCVLKDHIAEGLVIRFSFSFFVSTIILFLFLWLVAKDEKAISLFKSAIVAFFFSAIILFGWIAIAIGSLIGLGSTPKIFGYSLLKTFLIFLALLIIQYGILFIFLNYFSKAI